MREIFYELINEAKDGKVSIDGEVWPIGFNSNIEGNFLNNSRNLSTLVVKNEKEFLELLKEYIDLELYIDRKHMMFDGDHEKNHIKSLMAYVFINMSTEDFLNPVDCLRRRIGFLKDTTFSLFDEEVDFKAIPDAKLLINQSVQSIYMETPYIMDFAIQRGSSYIRLPYISYGICEEDGKKVCYIYSIMNHPLVRGFVIDGHLAKDVNRIMFKLNKGVMASESQEYRDYKDGKTDEFVENISDVTPSFVFVLVTFLTMLQSKGITEVRAVPYLPVRYLSRAIAAENTTDPNVRKTREERNNQIQRNATDKFTRTFRRAAYHMQGAEIVSYPYELDENLRMKLHGNDVNNDLLKDVSEQVMGR